MSTPGPLPAGGSSDGPAKPSAAMALGFLLAFSALALSTWHAWAHPAFAGIDEPDVLGILAKALSGQGLSIAWAQGSLTHLAYVGVSGLFGRSLRALHSLNGIMLAAELMLLYRFCRVTLGSQAALGAVLFSAVSCLTPLRAHALCSFAWLPFWSLWAANLATFPSARARFFSGLVAGLLALDYEGWLLALPGFSAFVLLRSKGHERAPFVKGLLAGLAVSAGLSAGELGAWWSARMQTLQHSSHAASAVPWERLSLLFSGAWNNIPHLSVQGHAWLPPWAWAWLALGLAGAWKHKGLLLWAMAPFAALLIYSQNLETNRLIGAWPALAILAGLGVQRLAAWTNRPGLALKLLLVSALAGAPFELKAWQEHWRRSAWNYEAGELVQVLRDEAVPQGPGTGALLLTHAHDLGQAVRYAVGTPQGLPDDARLLILLPRDLRVILGPKKAGKMRVPQSPVPGLPAVYEASKEEYPRFLALDRALEALAKGRLPLAEAEERRLDLKIRSSQGEDPIYRALLWDRWLHLADGLGLFRAADLDRLLAEPGINGTPLCNAAFLFAEKGDRASLRRLLAVIDERGPQQLMPVQRAWLASVAQDP